MTEGVHLGYTPVVAKKSGFRLGIDLGGSKIFVALLADDEVVCSDKKRTRAELGYDGVLARIVKLTTQVCKQADVPFSRLGSVGIGVPSPVVNNELLHAPNLGWKKPPLARDLGKLLSVSKVRLGNDVNCGALGEAMLGAAKGRQSVFALFIGTGLGGGWVHKGRVHEGVSGFAGEVGHLQIPGELALCACGQVGCLETVASKRGLQRLLKAARERGEPCLIDDLEELRSKALDEAYRDGCPSTTRALSEMARHLAWAMNAIAAVVNPDTFVLGGGIGERVGPDLLPLIEKVRSEAVFVRANGNYDVRIGKLGPASVAVGAATLGRV